MLFPEREQDNSLVKIVFSMDIHGGYVVLDTPVSEKMISKLPEESLEINAYCKSALGLVSTGTPGNPDLNPVDKSMITKQQPSFSQTTIPSLNNTATPKRPRNLSTPYITPGGPAILTRNDATKHSHFNNFALITPLAKNDKFESDVIQLQPLDEKITQKQNNENIPNLDGNVSAR